MRTDKDMRKKNLPRSVRAMIAASVVAGLGALALRVPDLLNWGAKDLLAFVGLAAATVLGEQFTLQFRQRSETKNISLTDAVFAGALLLARPSVLTMAVALGVLAGHSMRGWKAHKVAFNVGSFLVSITAAELVYGALSTTGSLNAGAWMAAGAGMIAFFLVNAGSVVTVIALAEGKSFASVFAPILRVETIHAVGNAAIGIVAAVMWMTGNPAVPALLVAPLASWFLYDAWLRDVAGRRQVLPFSH
jgi:hypothetical protein